MKLSDLVIGGGGALALVALLCALRNSSALGNLVARNVAEKQPPRRDRQAAPPVEPPVRTFSKQEVPSSTRSREVVSRVAPRLIRELAAAGLECGQPVFMRVFKEEKQLELFVERDQSFVLFRTYRVAACSGVLGPKLAEGDRQAPEGFYSVPPSRMNPDSRFHLSFNIGYPNAFDRANGRTGSALMVHGGEASIGCFAMTDSGIEEIYTLAEAALRNGQKSFPVHCFPFRMTAANMRRHRNSKWYPFWQLLKEGHDCFVHTSNPPDVAVRGKDYVID